MLSQDILHGKALKSDAMKACVSTSTSKEAIDKAREMIGLTDLKVKQKEAIRAFLEGRDVFVSLPTGYGKSIIYGIYHK